jgi:hypothetical protein
MNTNNPPLSGSSSQQPSMYMFYGYLRIGLFIAHAVTALVFLIGAFNGDPCTITALPSPAFKTMLYIDPAAMPSPPYAMASSPMAYPSYRAFMYALTAPPPAACNNASIGAVMGYNSNNQWAYAQLQAPAVAPSAILTANRTASLCAAMQTPHLLDQQEDARSFVIGSSWNVYVLIIVVEWIAASFALLVLTEPLDLWRAIPMPPGVHPVPAIATLWNLVLLVLLWFYRNTLLVPDNNLMLFTFVIMAAILIQNYAARFTVPSSNNSGGAAQSAGSVDRGIKSPAIDLSRHQEYQSSSSKVGYSGGGQSTLDRAAPAFVWRTDHFLHHRRRGNNNNGGGTGSGGQGESEMLLYGAPSMGADNGGSSSSSAIENPLHSQDYAVQLDTRGDGVAVRFMGFTCTVPLLLIATYITYNNSMLVDTFQLLIITSVAYNGFGIPMHFALMMLRLASGADRPKLQAAGTISMLSFVIAFATAALVYTDSASYILLHQNTGTPEWVVGMMWTTMLLLAIMVLGTVYFYVPWLWNPDAGSGNRATDAAEMWMKTFNAEVFWMDVLPFVLYLTVSWSIYRNSGAINCIAPIACA